VDQSGIFSTKLYKKNLIKKETCETAPIPKGGNRKKVLNEHHIAFIKELTDENCHISLHSIQEQLEAVDEIEVSLSTIHRVIGAFNYAFKRVPFRPLLGETEEMYMARRNFSTWLLRQDHERKTNIFP